MNMTVSHRLQSVQDPVIAVVNDLIQETPGTISLGQGVVHYGPPPETIEKLIEFADGRGNHVYQDVPGIPTLRELINEKLASENNIDLSEREVVVTAGSNMGFLNAVLSIADPGDEIVLLNPYYFNHEMAVRIAGCIPVFAATDENHQPRLDAIESALSSQTRAVVTISPNNPSGAVYDKDKLLEINELCEKSNVYHITDEAYEYFVYGDAHQCYVASFPESNAHTISLFSLSKSYGFASWRIGYMLIPNHLMNPVLKIQDSNLICPPVVSQYGAIGALQAGPEYCKPFVNGLNDTRLLVKEALNTLRDRVYIAQTSGAFFYLLRINTPMSAMKLVQRLIEEHQIGLVPGDAFGLQNGCYLRLSYGALQANTVDEGVGRLVAGIENILSRDST